MAHAQRALPCRNHVVSVLRARAMKSWGARSLIDRLLTHGNMQSRTYPLRCSTALGVRDCLLAGRAAIARLPRGCKIVPLATSGTHSPRAPRQGFFGPSWRLGEIY